MSLKEHGVTKYGRLIRQNVDQAQYLAALVDAAPDLERLAPAPLNIVCFRYNPGGLDDADLNPLNQEILFHLHERGLAVPTYTTLGGRYALRVANTNHRSRRQDFHHLVESVRFLGQQLRADCRDENSEHD
jgi:glutamate/tyrosine decarboxylase-like PLP-dependent enzyme